MIENKNTKVYPLTDQQKGFWFIDKLNPKDNRYNNYIHYEITGLLDKPKFTQAIHAMLQVCDTFRTKFKIINNEVFQEVSSEVTESILEYCDISNNEIPTQLLQERAIQILETKNSYPYDLEKDFPSRIILIKVSQDKFYFGLCQHHIVADAQSAYLMCDFISMAYNQGKDIVKKKHSGKMS